MTAPFAVESDTCADLRAVLSVEGLSGGFGTPEKFKPVLDGVSFSVYSGKLTAVVGETGSGKSITAMSILQVQPRAFVHTGGRIVFDGLDLVTCGEKTLQDLRGRRISMVFQDAKGALNPVIPVGVQLADVCRRHRKVSRAEARSAAVESLQMVQIPEPARRAKQYAHELSGGTAQRVMIAMALICEPELLILDEPTTGLDVTIQAEIMQLITDLGRDAGVSTLLITHDLGVVAETADHVAVMRDGSVVEAGTTERVFLQPAHPYTRALIDASKLGAKR